MTERTQARASSGSGCVGCGAAFENERCGHCGITNTAGRWAIEQVISQSAHSRVYRARDDAGREVALKELHFALVPSVEQLEAFEREAKTLSSLNHPAVPRFVDSFTLGSGVAHRLYLATEFVHGESLATRLNRGPLTTGEAVRLAQAALRVLVFLQSRTPALFHRDLKPGNIMFRLDGSMVLVDFGSARRVDGSRTHRSTLVGTFGYMPPEQLGGTVDKTSDVFALGATLLHALTGRPPADLLHSGYALAVPPSVDPQIRHWLERAVSFEPKARFQSAREALDALEGHGTVAQAKAPSRPFVLGALTALLVASAGALFLMKPREAPPTLPPARQPTAAVRDWFSSVKSRCNSLEVNAVMAQTPPPAGPQGRGDGAGCYALAARYADARRMIETLPVGERAVAAGRVFDIAHPVADQGDDDAAGPMMEVVLDFWPENYMALYHAGIAEYRRADTERARTRLTQFMSLYHQEDGFTGQARAVLERIAQGLPADPDLRPLD